MESGTYDAKFKQLLGKSNSNAVLWKKMHEGGSNKSRS
jgi:hypothetical protein